MQPYFFIFGFGYTAEFLARELCNLHFQVVGTTRNKEKTLGSCHLKYPLIDFYGTAVEHCLSRATHILACIPPSAQTGDPVLAEYGELIKRNASHLQWVGYLSSTGVYGDHQGAWVDESSLSLMPGSQGQLRLAAEQAWLSYTKLPVHIFRLAGIYGPRRNALARIGAGKKTSIYKEGQYFSRIHVDDIIAVLLASIDHPNPSAIYNVADDEPAPSHQVDAYAAHLLDHPPLELKAYEEALLSSMEQQFYSSNRRVANAKIKKELGVQLKFPSYREGLKQIFQNDY